MTTSRREFVIVAAGGLLSACGVANPRRPEAPGAIATPAQLLVRSGGRIMAVSLEEYVLGSVVAEVAPIGESAGAVDRIFQVQAILARSYAAAHPGRHRAEGFDLCDTVHCQVFDPARLRASRFAPAARDAVQRTSGVILAYSNRPASAVFHADCGGHTTAANAVWGGPAVPYLLPARDAVPAARHRDWTRRLPADDLLAILNGSNGTRVTGRRLTSLEVQTRDASGRAAQLRLGGDTPRTVRGEDFRTAVNRQLGDHTLQSTRFTVHRAGRTFVFEGTGFGHGVGLCQLGAAARARRGEAVDAILAAYFKGARLVRAKTA